MEYWNKESIIYKLMLFETMTSPAPVRIEPSAPELRRLMQLHGGAWRQYAGSDVTHLVATALSAAKRKSLRASLKVVRPAWITDRCAVCSECSSQVSLSLRSLITLHYYCSQREGRAQADHCLVRTCQL